MGEITDALRRARLEDELARRSETAEAEKPLVARTEAAPVVVRGSRGELSEPVADPASPAEPPEGEAASFVIPRSKSGFWQPRAVLIDPPLRSAECFRHFAVRVIRELEQRREHSVLVTSALPQEGKTTVACNLALSIASMAGGRRTALVDLDLHRSALRKTMGIQRLVGFERVLLGKASLEEARIATDVPGLDIYPVGTPRREAHELISGPRFERAVEHLNSDYDLVVFDGPPALPVPDVALAAKHIATCLVVTRRGVTPRRAYRELLSLVEPEKFLGVFLNDVRELRRAKGYSYYELDDVDEPGDDGEELE